MQEIVGAEFSSYSPEDQAFFRFWYAHMKDDLMQPPLANVRHSVARYIWDAAILATTSAVPVGEVKPVATFQGRRLTPEGTSEFWGSLLCDQSSDPPIGALLYTSPPTSESPCQFAIDNGGNLYRRYRDPVCAACVPAKKETDKWESARVADFNAGWNACRAAVLTTPPSPPEGWRMVPVEPTEAMLNAARDCQDADPTDGPESDAYYAYRAMLAAAPQPGDKA